MASQPGQLTGQARIALYSVDSTNSYLAQLATQRPAEGLVVTAQEQYAGRGQRGNSWQATPGLNLTLSVLYYPTFLAATDAFQLSKMAALAVVNLLKDYLPTQLQPMIKWPNDVLVAGKKVAGLLVENQLVGSQLAVSIIGIGLNVNQKDFTGDVAHKATSLLQLLGKPQELEPLLEKLLLCLDVQYHLLKNGGGTTLSRHYLAYLYRYQSWENYQDADGNFKGMIVGITQDGRLALQHAQEQALRYYAFKELLFI